MRPWTRWWWMGSSVESNSLSADLEGLKAIGIGGVEITPIYGVAGREQQFVPYLSSRWTDLFAHTLAEAERLNLGVDMATGTGWPFGGPWIGAPHACKDVEFRTFQLKHGERLNEPVTLSAAPLIRAVGNQVYQLYGEILRPPGERVIGTAQNPQLLDSSPRIALERLRDPIADTPNLQTLALDQVKFPKPLPLQALIAYSKSGAVLDLTRRVDADGRLDWSAPQGEWTLYAVFQGWHGKMVERAGPGGEGNVIDHFSSAALNHYLDRFGHALARRDIRPLRAFFNDSYEVDDANGQADWTPRLFAEFRRRRGYDLREHLPALFGNASSEVNARILHDYRETISDLLLENFTQPWRQWAHRKDALVRNQAHGSPANILDLYAASDIPETEGTDILRLKFASSAAHVTGKRLASAEAATWLNEHFLSTLSDVKRALDLYFIGGVNHVCYHGTAYSPQDEPWPGWLFYAAVHFNARNSWWEDFGTLNQYVTRVQSVLQSGKHDNDVLLYFPIADAYAERGPDLLRHFDGMPRGSHIQKTAEELQAGGFAFDLVSDRQLQHVKFSRGKLRAGGGAYQAILVPECHWMPLDTMQRLIVLAKEGARIVFVNGLPADVPGLHQLDSRRAKFKALAANAAFTETSSGGVQAAEMGHGTLFATSSARAGLEASGVARETMVDAGLQFFRGINALGTFYFVANRGERAVADWIQLGRTAGSVALFDAMTGNIGLLPSKSSTGESNSAVYLELAPGESAILQTLSSSTADAAISFHIEAGESQELSGPWRVTFLRGGPELPGTIDLSKLQSWTEFGGDAGRKFSGTAEYFTRFSTSLDDAAAGLWLDLGEVADSAQVFWNGERLATLIGAPFRIFVPRSKVHSHNLLGIRVSNIMANRIADMDRNKVLWKKFYNVNFPARLAANRRNGVFDASDWEPLLSGLRGPVTLTPAQERVIGPARR
ncbi:MAG TPA: glycosyl hydrolase [Verrucomicrobiae bacterium]|nr:glycosyl hydrolase [Verrucomicrobiae bacterium]